MLSVMVLTSRCCCFRESLGLEDLPDLMVTLVIRYPWQLWRLGHVQSNEFSFKNALFMSGFSSASIGKRCKTRVIAFLELRNLKMLRQWRFFENAFCSYKTEQMQRRLSDTLTQSWLYSIWCFQRPHVANGLETNGFYLDYTTCLLAYFTIVCC